MDAPSPIETMNDLMFGRGWSRVFAPGAVSIFWLLASDPLTVDELDAAIREGDKDNLGLESSAWESLHEYTDEELAEQRKSFKGTSFASTDDDLQTAAVVDEEERLNFNERLEEAARFFAHFGIATDHRLSGTLALMIARDVVVPGDDHRLHLNPLAPLPSEVLPISSEEASLQDELRWARLHEGFGQQIIRLFALHGVRRERIQTDLSKLARQLEIDIESAREGLLELIADGDFRTSIDVGTAREAETMEIIVDWEAFEANRITIGYGDA